MLYVLCSDHRRTLPEVEVGGRTVTGSNWRVVTDLQEREREGRENQLNDGEIHLLYTLTCSAMNLNPLSSLTHS